LQRAATPPTRVPEGVRELLGLRRLASVSSWTTFARDVELRGKLLVPVRASPVPSLSRKILFAISGPFDCRARLQSIAVPPRLARRPARRGA